MKEKEVEEVEVVDIVEEEEMKEAVERNETIKNLQSQLDAIVESINNVVEMTDKLILLCPYGIDKYNAKTIQNHLKSALKRCEIFATRTEFLKSKKR